MDVVLEALAVLFETEGLAALAAPLVDPLRGLLLLLRMWLWLLLRVWIQRQIVGGRRRRRRMVGSLLAGVLCVVGGRGIMFVSHRHRRRPGHKALLAAVGIVVRRIVGGGTRSVGAASGNRSSRHCCLELVLKGAGVPLQDGLASVLDLDRVFVRVVAGRALALGAAGRRKGKALAVELEALGLFTGARAALGEGLLCSGAVDGNVDVVVMVAVHRKPGRMVLLLWRCAKGVMWTSLRRSVVIHVVGVWKGGMMRRGIFVGISPVPPGGTASW